MLAIRGYSNSLKLAHYVGTQDDKEFALLYGLNTSKTPHLPYCKYIIFDLDSLTGRFHCGRSEIHSCCKIEFRFYRSDIYALRDVFEIHN